jgi:hypothetical protein
MTESERWEEFDRFLGSKKALDLVRRHFISFLESERKEEFTRFLGSEKTLGAVRSQFIAFLGSYEGKRLLVELLSTAFASGELAPILKEEFVRFLESQRTRDAVNSHFSSFCAAGYMGNTSDR